MKGTWILVCLGGALELAGCSGRADRNPCENVDCSNHGRCLVKMDVPVCQCDKGYHTEDLACMDDRLDLCAAVTCSGHGSCGMENGAVYCRCEEGYHPEGLSCVINEADPCLGVTCSDHGVCRTEQEQAICTCDDGYHPQGASCLENTWDPPPTVTACQTPTIHPGGVLPAASDAMPISPALAWDGTRAALVVAELADENDQRYNFRFQLLTKDGQLEGDSQMLATDVHGSEVAIAGNGEVFVTCFGDELLGEITCLSLDPDSGTRLVGTKLNGYSPSMAFGVAGILLVYANEKGVWAQLLNERAFVEGPPRKISSNDLGYNPVTATAQGYAVVVSDPFCNTNCETHFYRLKADLSVKKSSFLLSKSPDTVRVAASGENVIVLFGESDQVSAITIRADDSKHDKIKVDAPGALDTFGPVAVAGGTESFALVWSAFEGYIGYRSVSQAGQGQGEVLQAAQSGWDDNPVALVAVDDGFLLAVSFGIMSSPSIHLFHLACP